MSGENGNVVSLNPTFVNAGASGTRSLLDRARSGDADAFGEICRAYETRLLRQAMVLCGNETIAAELAQDTLVEAWKFLRRYNERCKFFTWLCAILLNRYHNTVRQRRPLSITTLVGRDQDEARNRLVNLTDPQPLPDEMAQTHEQATAIWECVQALPAKQQEVIYLRFYVDASLEGIASALNCSVGTVKSRLFHALDKLRDMRALGTQLANFKSKGGIL